jgi:hypothetical protein
MMASVTVLMIVVAGGPFTYFFPWAPFNRPEPRAGVGAATCEQTAQVGATWTYNWGPTLSGCNNGVEAVPMIWGPGSLEAASEETMPPGDFLLVGNECDLTLQCGKTPEEMAAFWHEVQTRFPKRKLIGSNVSEIGGAAYQLAWMQAHVAIYGEKPDVYALAIHCYGPLTGKCEITIEAMIDLAAEWSVSGEIWLSEFAVPAHFVAWDKARQLAESEQYLDWVDRRKKIARYAWFMYDMETDPAGFTDDGSWQTGLSEHDELTPLGEMYRETVAPGRWWEN